MINKQAISPVVAVSLLLVVGVLSVVGFQSWFQTFSSATFSLVESQSMGEVMSGGVKTILGSNLYFNNNYNKNITITKITIDNVDCGFSGVIESGLQNITLDNTCLTENVLSSVSEVVVYTSEGIFSTKMKLSPIIICSLDGINLSDNENYTFYKYSMPYNSLLGCSAISQNRNCSNGILDGSSEYDTASCDDALAPSQGGEWVLVFNNPLYSTGDFYVMKYEAKEDSSGTCVDGESVNCPISQVLSSPWRWINQNDSMLECESLGDNYSLISNLHWMTIARDVESISDNWADDSIGSLVAEDGGLYRGNINLVDSVSCGDFNILDANSEGSDCVVSSRNKRVFNISSGEVIWDFSGNAFEWTNDSLYCGAGGILCTSVLVYDSSPASELIELTSINTYGSLSYDLVRPINSSWNSFYGMGKIFSDASTAVPTSYYHSFMRGGSYGDGSANGGVYSLYLISSSGRLDQYTGFRCIYQSNINS